MVTVKDIYDEQHDANTSPTITTAKAADQQLTDKQLLQRQLRDWKFVH